MNADENAETPTGERSAEKIVSYTDLLQATLDQANNAAIKQNDSAISQISNDTRLMNYT